jgi:16S rRNA (cytidine1402-2'-O)-methyltransferase
MDQRGSPVHAGCLYVVATPIGNMEDITLRALRVLAEVDLIAAEDTRHTRQLLTAHGLSNELVSYHEYNEARRSMELVEKMHQGACIALTTNAGTPMVSDPGYRLVHDAVNNGIRVVPIPGVSAAIAALSASGLATDRFTFIGFPERKKSKLRQQIKANAELYGTLVFYQSPRRLTAFLEELLSILGDRPAVVAREVTKIHEEFLRGRLSDILALLAERQTIKGECTILVEPAPEQIACSQENLDDAIRAAFADEQRPLSDIARDLAGRFGLKRKDIYDRALKIKKET